MSKNICRYLKVRGCIFFFFFFAKVYKYVKIGKDGVSYLLCWKFVSLDTHMCKVYCLRTENFKEAILVSALGSGQELHSFSNLSLFWFQPALISTLNLLTVALVIWTKIYLLQHLIFLRSNHPGSSLWIGVWVPKMTKRKAGGRSNKKLVTL